MDETQGARTLLHNVSDLKAATEFYTQLLGLKPQVVSDYYVGFNTAGQHVGLVPNQSAESDSPVAYWHVDDIEDRMAAMINAGGALRSEVADVGNGRRVGTVADADGNVIGLLQDN